MCGIVGYIGSQQAPPIILDGLKRLEYRGYDSAGICTIFADCADIRRSEGKLANLVDLVGLIPIFGEIGIGHTRWATHGKPTEINAHPHQAGPIVLVHNGIIENYIPLKSSLREIGHTFKSETDTEVIAHLIEQRMKDGAGFEEAVRQTLLQLKGAYALCIVCESEPDTMIAAKHGSPLVVGIGDGEYFVASDIPAILAQTREMVFLEDREIAVFRRDGVAFSTITGEVLSKATRHIDWSPLMAEKGGFRHFMLKEIFEQPRAVQDTMAGRLLEEEGNVYLEDLGLTDAEMAGFSRICIVACGTSWHAGLVGKFLLEELCRISVEVDIASEFRYRNPVVSSGTLLLAISQSGETADTLAAVREAHGKGAKAIAICNVVDSSIAREADGVVYTHAGLEIGVASTKAFVTQLVAISLFALRFGRATGAISRERGIELTSSLLHLPAFIEEALQLDTAVESIARRYHNSSDFLYLGRGYSYPIALEGALKLKEISYIHAEGYPAGEMKHGPIALIDENMPVVMLVLRDRHYEKVVSNMEEVIARGGRVIALCSAGDSETAQKAEAVLELPSCAEIVAPIILSIPLQLLAYHVSVLKGNDVDQPRNLAKSVTVE
ncbi:glutamine--fructose-6-phosphate transaminase (isomerizing) [Geobacter pelophilus]|uniref:Glutamine--fructose-6-phosphate aminotransferase [isomerizing] n=1 Tax=Geoanaerobacter pelophilus TaxID=60036 RepID=A0AAW4LC77_9BACT|nr:glutamine--fructose-6-phosphate transaminase (isomerizing) [Geoanaerobacter pelophilus]MBT0666175.1 glutamine--fructose-6-phosphate transaminase (isomerizing) [Geoanaerobacter pelophilus]